ncbi:MYND finger [Ancylostoma duodenale]|uniref:MYND finger n=1 Tax=Ancylostoma duodenale TaxID=51022 RepID=A0A0C2GUC5_9BILA|nr:MYND finger [Ancylostoma duodenale]
MFYYTQALSYFIACIFRRCLGCGFALFCGKECQTLGWKDHKAECKGLRKVSSIPDIEIRMLGRIVLRHKEICSGKDKKTENFYKDRTSKRSLLEIWAHTDLIQKDHYAMRKFEDIYEQLVGFYETKFLLPKEIVFELHCRDYINRHAISDRGYMKFQEIGKGLYLDLCAYDHSCRPNTIYTCNGFIATLRALNSNVVMEDKTRTFYSYIDLLSSLQQRKKQLKDTWYFDCQCERCTDPDDHILTSILCPRCPLRKLQEYVMEAVSAMRFVDKIIEDREMEQMPKKTRIEFLEDLLERFTKILSGSNIYLCKLIQIHSCSRNIGIFLNNLDRCEEAVKYFREADEILEFTLDSGHPMTVENRELLEQTLKNLGIPPKTEKVENSAEKDTAAHEKASSNVKAESSEEKAAEDPKNGVQKKAENSIVTENTNPEKPKQAAPPGKTKQKMMKYADLFSDDLSDLPDLIL